MDIDVAIPAIADVRRANIPELRRALNSMFAHAKDVATRERLVSHVLELAHQAPSADLLDYLFQEVVRIYTERVRASASGPADGLHQYHVGNDVQNVSRATRTRRALPALYRLGCLPARAAFAVY